MKFPSPSCCFSAGRTKKNNAELMADFGIPNNNNVQLDDDDDMDIPHNNKEEVMSADEEEDRDIIVVGGYNKDKPPHDDCCPICFDDFHFPTRTSCGHWFCSKCILELWRYSSTVKPCKCPMCGSSIAKLIPDSFVLMQTGEEAREILGSIQKYNCLVGEGLASLYLKTLAIPTVIRGRSREYLSPLMLRNIYSVARMIGIFLGMLYDSYKFQLFPRGGLWIQFMFEICGYILVMFLILDAVWYHWKLRRRARNLAENVDLG